MEKTIGLWQAIAIAVGSMIGASIFSIFGLGFDLNGIAAITSAVFVVLMIYQWNTNRSAFYATWIAFAVSLMVEIIYRGISRREMV
ncbi:MAG TPA: hypothetical protein ENJ19_05305, partial [Gammaproteobacteria bacterium]|nr:hypothetical protein [Gammaproteobacteria bacterium]